MNIFTVIYETIRANHLEFGYAKSPDFMHKQDYIKNKKFKSWLRNKGKAVDLLKGDDSSLVNALADDDYNIRSGTEQFYKRNDGLEYYEKIAWQRITE